MIIDLTEKFNQIRKSNEEKRDILTHTEYLEKYYNVRKIICKSGLEVLLREEYDNVFDIYEEDEWSKLASLSVDLYEAEDDLFDYYENLFEKLNMEMVERFGDIGHERYHLFDEESIKFSKVLIEIDRLMMMVARFRENFCKKISDESFIFSSYLDYIVTSDYLKLSILENFIMQHGHFNRA